MKIPKSGYKHQIEQELLKRNWKITIAESNGEWWSDGHWEVEFKFNPQIVFIISFIVDPQFEGPQKKGQIITKVKASTVFPKDWKDGANDIASICMSKRKFDLKLKEFIQDIEKYRITAQKA